MSSIVGDTVFHAASRLNRPKMVARFLEIDQIRKSFAICDPGYGQALFLACENINNVQIVKQLLQAKADVNLLSSANTFPLHQAIKRKDCKLLHLLLSSVDVDVNVNVRSLSNRGRTPLHAAAASGAVDCLRLLLAHSSIDVNILDMDGHSALLLASLSLNIESFTVLAYYPKTNLNMLIGVHSSKTILHHLCYDKIYIAQLRIILQNNSININALMDSNQSALHIAAIGCNADAFESLLNSHRQVNVLAINNLGLTPLNYALSNQCVHIFNLGIRRERKYILSALAFHGGILSRMLWNLIEDYLPDPVTKETIHPLGDVIFREVLSMSNHSC
jgi:ankyrin repeat protein